MNPVIALALLPVFVLAMLWRRPMGRRAAPYALVALGAALCALHYTEQDVRLLVSSLVLAAGLVWTMGRHDY